MATVILDHRERVTRWLDRRPSRALLPLSYLYALGLRLDRRLRPREPLPADPPSLTIGNLRVGGSGKTPLVGDLGGRLAARGLRVSVLSRGYRAEGDGDEPQWLRARGLSVELGSDRRRSFERARADGAHLVLLDDGLQSRVRALCTAAVLLDRDLSAPPRLLPAGPAREGMAALERVQFLFVRCEGTTWPPAEFPRPKSLPSEADLYAFRLVPYELKPLDPAGGALSAPCGLLSGLARPESFERDAADFGIDAVSSLRLPDHARPGRAERAAIEDCCRRFGLRSVVLPEKNQIRFAALLFGLGLKVHVLRSRVEWQEDPLPRIVASLGLDPRQT